MSSDEITGEQSSKVSQNEGKTRSRERVRVAAPAPSMPSADIQELLVHRVTEQSISLMRKKITAVLSVITLIAGVLGVKGFLSIKKLDDQLKDAQSQMDSSNFRLAALSAAVAQVETLEAKLKHQREEERADFHSLLNTYSQAASSANGYAIQAATQATLATSAATQAASSVRERQSAFERLRDTVAAATRGVAHRDAAVQEIEHQLHTQLFETWNVVLDEGAGWAQVGTTPLDARVTRIHAGHIVDVQLRDRSTQTVFCTLELQSAGVRGACDRGSEKYFLTLVLSLKQGGLFGLFGLYRDRAEVQIVRMTDAGADIAAHAELP